MVWLAAVMAPVLLLAACAQDATSPSHFATFATTDLKVGTGITAAAGDTIVVRYTGWLYNESATDHKGAVFDSSVGSTDFTFTLGVGQVITGWDEGLVGMKTGGVRRLVIPPSLAYGATRSSIIPPEATLLFEVELVDVKWFQ
jgi:FKBP-type peptidyl-prolyl cis-trans isomerase FkpA